MVARLLWARTGCSGGGRVGRTSRALLVLETQVPDTGGATGPVTRAAGHRFEPCPRAGRRSAPGLSQLAGRVQDCGPRPRARRPREEQRDRHDARYDLEPARARRDGVVPRVPRCRAVGTGGARRRRGRHRPGPSPRLVRPPDRGSGWHCCCCSPPWPSPPSPSWSAPCSSAARGAVARPPHPSGLESRHAPDICPTPHRHSRLPGSSDAARTSPRSAPPGCACWPRPAATRPRRGPGCGCGAARPRSCGSSSSRARQSACRRPPEGQERSRRRTATSTAPSCHWARLGSPRPHPA